MKPPMKRDHARANHFNQSPRLQTGFIGPSMAGPPSGSVTVDQGCITGLVVMKISQNRATITGTTYTQFQNATYRKFLTYRRTLAKNFTQAFESHLFK
jgi:hypothetical protein